MILQGVTSHGRRKRLSVSRIKSVPRAEQIIEYVTTYFLVGRGHMSSLTESEKQMIIEFLKRE